MRTINGASRGCGSLQAGGFYAQGTIGNGGQLQPWSWCFGSGFSEGHNLWLNPPNRQMIPIQLAESLYEGRIVQPGADRQAFNNSALNKLPNVAILDHVGSNNYTPFSFAAETAQRGVSRRIPQNIAKQLGKHVPIPIVFSHEWMPVISEQEFELYYEWFFANSGSDVYTPIELLETRPSFYNPEWGIEKGKNSGGYHWLRYMIAAMDQVADGKVRPMQQVMPHALSATCYLAEQSFGISWITDVVYIADGTEDDAQLNHFLSDGIEPVRVGND